jgi:anion-transporting  ArsA/GET3 family ATPase
MSKQITNKEIEENIIYVKDLYIQFKDLKYRLESILDQLDEKTKTSNKLYIDKIQEVFKETEEVLKNIDEQSIKQDIKNNPIFISIHSLIEELTIELNNLDK